MKKYYEKPEFALAVFESENEISARGDWELGISRGVIDPYGFGDDGIEEQGGMGGEGGEGEGAGGAAYSTSNLGSNFGW